MQLIFQPSGRRGPVEPGGTLLEGARRLGVDLESPCGGAGTCGKCRVKVETGFFPKYGVASSVGHLSEPAEAEKEFFARGELAAGYRLACLARVKGDAVVYIPEESRRNHQVVLEKGLERRTEIDPAVAAHYLKLPQRSESDLRGDWEWLRDALVEIRGLPRDLGIAFPALRKLAAVLREGRGELTVWIWQEREVIDIHPGRRERLYGVAVDVGTTTMAAYLCDLTTGKTMATRSSMNPQVRFGEDVLSRISHSSKNGGLEELRRTVIDGINELIAALTEEANIKPDQVADLTLVFNTAMHHIALGLDPSGLGRTPFLPAIKEALDLRASDLGIIAAKGAKVHLLPVEAGFVGPDNMAVILAESPHTSEETKLIIDIGTNGEIVLGNRHFLASTSCATGPALEGAQITFGMRAAPGAIEKVRIDPDSLEPRYRVIGEERWSDQWSPEKEPAVRARGICGSGIIDIVAELFRRKVIQPGGRFNKGLPTPRLRTNAAGKSEYVLAWAPETAIGQDIVITQGDIRAVQLAKAALYVGARFLMEKTGVEKVDRVILAGAFGSYLDRENALILGMFPDCSPERISSVGNAAGDGAKIVLLDRKKREEAKVIAKQIRYVETIREKEFQSRFVDAMAFPHARDPFPNLAEILGPMAASPRTKG